MWGIPGKNGGKSQSPALDQILLSTCTSIASLFVTNISHCQIIFLFSVHFFNFLFCRFVASMVYYGISFNTRNLAGNIYVNICISGAVEIPALLFVVFIHNKLGRRLTNSMLMGLAGVCCFSFLILDLTSIAVFYLYEL